MKARISTNQILQCPPINIPTSVPTEFLRTDDPYPHPLNNLFPFLGYDELTRSPRSPEIFWYSRAPLSSGHSGPTLNPCDASADGYRSYRGVSPMDLAYTLSAVVCVKG